jgi:hypothetical protein
VNSNKACESGVGRIRRLDVAHRELLGSLRPFGVRGDDDRWDDEDISLHQTEEHHKVKSELYFSRRVLVHAVEGYLLGCVEYPALTGEGALMRATSTDRLTNPSTSGRRFDDPNLRKARGSVHSVRVKIPLHGLQHSEYPRLIAEPKIWPEIAVDLVARFQGAEAGLLGSVPEPRRRLAIICSAYWMRRTIPAE